MLTTGLLTAAIALAGTALSAAFPSINFELPASFDPQLQNYEPESLLPVLRRDGGNCGSSSYYNPSVGTGACGWQNSDNELVVALPSQYFQGRCGQSITIAANGKRATAKIVDLCPSCEGGHVDMSPALFQQFTDLSQGRVNTCWTYGAVAGPVVVPLAGPAATSTSPAQKQAAPAPSSSDSFPPDFEPPRKSEQAATTESGTPTLATSTSQSYAGVSSDSPPLAPSSMPSLSLSAAPTTLYTTVTRVRTLTMPPRTSTVSSAPSNTGAELYEAAVSQPSAPLPTKDVVGGLLGAVQRLHRGGWDKNATHAVPNNSSNQEQL